MTDRVVEASLGSDGISVEVIEGSFAELAVLGGSPTILIDGVDPFPGADTGSEPHCRLYLTAAGFEGAPAVVDLRAALAASVTPGATT